MPTVNVEQNRAAIKAALKVNPGRSNRYIGRLVGVHHVTVGLVRRLMEKAGEMPRMVTTLGADGKTYSTARVQASKPVAKLPAKTSNSPLDEMLSTTLRAMSDNARKEGRVEELATALRRHAKRLSIEAKPQVASDTSSGEIVHVPAAAAASSRTCNAETLPPRPISVQSSEKDDVNGSKDVLVEQQQPAAPGNQYTGPVKASDRSSAAERPPAPAAPPPPATNRDHPKPVPPRSWRDVARDIAPDAERRALSNERAAARHPSDAPNHAKAGSSNSKRERGQVFPQPQLAAAEPVTWWEQGQVIHLHQATQCGRVRLPEGEVNFTDHTPREAGLVLKTGMDVDVRLIERHPGWVQVVELARPQVEA